MVKAGPAVVLQRQIGKLLESHPEIGEGQLHAALEALRGARRSFPQIPSTMLMQW